MCIFALSHNTNILSVCSNTYVRYRSMSMTVEDNLGSGGARKESVIEKIFHDK